MYNVQVYNIQMHAFCGVPNYILQCALVVHTPYYIFTRMHAQRLYQRPYVRRAPRLTFNLRISVLNDTQNIATWKLYYVRLCVKRPYSLTLPIRYTILNKLYIINKK